MENARPSQVGAQVQYLRAEQLQFMKEIGDHSQLGREHFNVNPGTEQPSDAAICPLCGQPNQCALAADPTATECWCDSEVFPRGLLELIPENAVRRTCVCKKCLLQYRESAEDADTPS